MLTEILIKRRSLKFISRKQISPTEVNVFNFVKHLFPSSSSSSLGATTSIVECFDLLNIQFPIIAILDAASPILYFQFLHDFSYVIFPSIFVLPNVLVKIGFHLHTFNHSVFWHSIEMAKPT